MNLKDERDMLRRKPEDFPACVHRYEGIGFWDGTDASGRRVGGRMWCFSCEKREDLEDSKGFLAPTTCRECPVRQESAT